MNKADYNNALRRDTYDLPGMAAKLFEENDRPLKFTITTPELFSFRKILITGCGDSYCAGLAMQAAFEELSGNFVDVLTTIELSRHYDGSQLGGAPNNPLVLAISSSGGVSRVIEAVRRANESGTGALTVAVTANAESPLANECRRTLQIKFPALEKVYEDNSPGMRSYYASMYALMTLAVRIGEVKLHYPMNESVRIKKAAIAYTESFAPEMERIDDQMFELAQKWKGLKSFEFVGSGLDFASAWFGAAKIVEASGDIATYADTENWLHVNYFANNPTGIGTVVVLDKDSPAFAKTLDAIEVMAELGRPTLVVTDADSGIFPETVEVCTIPTAEIGWQKPMMQPVPIALLAGYLAKIKDTKFFRLGEINCGGDMNNIRSSLIEVV